MKRFSLFVVAILLATATFAQRIDVKPQKQLKPDFKLELPVQLQQKLVIEQPARMAKGLENRVLEQQKATKAKLKNARQNHLGTSAARKAPAALMAPANVISETPEGAHKYMYRNCSAYYVYVFYVLSAQVENGVGEIVVDGSTLYLKNPISQYPSNTWIKGTITGASVTFEFPQTIGESGGEELVVDLFDYDANEQWFNRSKKKHSLTFNYFKGNMTINDADFVSGNTILGLAMGSDMSWTGYADWDIQLTQFDETPVEVPAELTTQQYVLSRYNGDGVSEGNIVELGIDNSNVYVKGICTDAPDAWIKGVAEDGKFTFQNAQFIGATATDYVFLMGADSVQAYDDYYEEYYTDYTLNGKDVVFNYDAAKDAYLADGSFLVNIGKSYADPVNEFNSAVLAPFKEVAATPTQPIIKEFSPMDDAYGYGYIDFVVPSFDVNGNYINEEKVTYQLYVVVNGKERILETTNDVYVSQEEEKMNEWTLDYGDGWDVYPQGGGEVYFYFYVTGFEKIGVQTIYRGGGEERRSEIAYYVATDDSQNQAAEAKTAVYNEAQVNDTDNSIIFTNATDDNINVAGSGKAETYDVAMQLTDPNLLGSYIKSIQLPIIDPEVVTNVSAWLTTELRIDDNDKNVPNLVSKQADLNVVDDNGYVVVTLDKPYLIGEDPVFVGYTFTVTDAESDYGAMPVAICEPVSENGLFIHSDKTYLKWLNYVENYGGNSAIQVTVAGQNIKSDAAIVSQPKASFIKKGEAGEATINVINYGGNGVQSLELECEVAGQSYTTTVTLDQPISNFFGASGVATVQIPAIAELGHYDATYKVTKVNGQPNEYADIASTGAIEVISFVPIHRALLEEYTGTWCQYCPRGFVGLEEMNRLYPNDFIGVSYHNGDPMEIMDSYSFPSDVPGFPDAWLDRVHETDAFAGDLDYYSYQFGIDQAWLQQCEVFAPADIEVRATYNEAKTQVTATSTVIFPYTVENNKYLITYILTADGLTGTSNDWAQVNAYAGQEGWPEIMDMFTEAGSPVTNLEFCDVAIMAPDLFGMEGSLPATVPAEEAQTHTYTFDLSKAVSTSGENLVQDINKLNVVALLVDSETGQVMNANKFRVTSLVGIDQFASEDDNNAASIEFFDIAGRKLSPAQATGVVIKKIAYKDGSSKTVKVLAK
ncbi:MAG: hypothetical protein J6T52_00580 [Bacteroidaceae bacterium]|nr:hypothetical protein [Bacteroidaceae bacterium]